MKISKFILSVLLAAFSFTANAQKLPKIQTVSLRVPANIKIDGKATEWNGKFQAYSKISAFYTIANDDDKLYLIMQGKSEDVISKMIKGGVTLTINISGKKNDKEGAVVTYPAINTSGGFNINMGNKPKITHDVTFDKKKADSFMYVINNELGNKSKFITVSGIKEIADDSISIYNEYGIKATSLVDGQINYTYELAIPLKYLGLNISHAQKFIYNIKFNEVNDLGVGAVAKGIKSFSVVDGMFIVIGPTADRAMYLMNPTDFWGEYILAK
jgi:hypothetical protein